MKTITKRFFLAAGRQYREKGSALLVSLMIMVGLSLLGLSFVAISETESAIAVHERDSDQTLDAAEAGAKMVVEWFQDPTWASASANDFLPGNLATLKTQRRFTSQGQTLTNYYKEDLTLLLFDRPFAQVTDRFFGTETLPDVVINYSTADGLAFLNKLNGKMFTATSAVTSGAPEQIEGGGVRITDIRVFAPPIIGGTINANGFWDDSGTPYGLATIRVTAQKFGPSDISKTNLSQGKPLSTRFVKIIVAPWPFPGPQGPIQSNANISTGGAVGVHWGKMTAEGTMYIKNPWVSFNWFDAWDRPHFERGWDSSEAWQAAHAYTLGETVHPTTGAGVYKTDYSYECTTAGTSGATEPNWGGGAGPYNEGVGKPTWTRRPIKMYPLNTSSSPTQIDQYNWLYQVLNKTYEDPWFEARARGTIINAQNVGATGNMPYPYDQPTKDPVNNPDAGYSCWFQNQTTTFPKSSQMRQVVFPKIDYNFWKDIALSGAGTQGVYYLQWVSADTFSDGVTTKKMAKWVNTVTGAPPGFYFFDTQNKQNPQGPGAAGILTPAIGLNSSDDGNTFQMQGFVYLNCTFGTQGIGGPAGYQSYPGEPYRDVGYFRASLTTISSPPPGQPAQTKGAWEVDSSNKPVLEGAGDGTWGWEEIEWSNSGTDGTTAYTTVNNGKPDIFLKQRTVHLADGTTTSLWLPVAWYPGCHPGDNATLGADALGCSEPQEPFINLQYYQTGSISKAYGTGGRPRSVTTGWYAPGSEVLVSKKLNGSTPETCSSSDPLLWTKCTSNMYDRDGPLVDDITPILNGVLYLEGDMNSTGNAAYYGSVLINGSVDDKGTPDVWFDENLIKNTWPPASMKFPRVYVSAIQTDQQ